MRFVIALLALIAAPAAAQLTVKDANSAPKQLCTVAIAGGALAPCHAEVDTSGAKIDPATRQLQQQLLAAQAPLTFAPAAGGTAESSTAASHPFAAGNVALARGWYADCPKNTTVVVQLTDANGGTRPRTLFDGPQGDRERIAGYSGNAGCTIGLEY